VASLGALADRADPNRHKRAIWVTDLGRPALEMHERSL
jgi:hypothetical protein